jgi:drug/metabolite transporter (DMT)-like permease
MILLFLAFNNLSIGTVYFLFYSTMTFTGILMGKVLFKERMDLGKYLALILVCIGLVIMFSESFAVGKIVYVLYALLVGVMFGFHNNFSKKISNRHHPLQIFFIAAVISFAVSLVLAIIYSEPMPKAGFDISYIWILIYGAIVLLADIFMINGYRRIEAQVASMIMPSEAIIAALFGWILFKDKMSTNIIIGGVLIIIAAMIPYLIKVLQGNRKVVLEERIVN